MTAACWSFDFNVRVIKNSLSVQNHFPSYYGVTFVCLLLPFLFVLQLFLTLTLISWFVFSVIFYYIFELLSHFAVRCILMFLLLDSRNKFHREIVGINMSCAFDQTREKFSSLIGIILKFNRSSYAAVNNLLFLMVFQHNLVCAWWHFVVFDFCIIMCVCMI